MSQITAQTVFDDILVRFIVNSPTKELSCIERLGFLIEQAYWFYEDFYFDRHPKELPKYTSLKNFALALYSHCPDIFPVASGVKGAFEAEFNKFLKYKSSVPVVGAVLMNEKMNEIVLVQGFHAKKDSWTFPKGKINQNESFESCAIREVFEETSFDIKNLIKSDFFIEIASENQIIRLYIVCGVPSNAKFFPRTRKEIRVCSI